jgi:sulfite reductase (NADPH) flavoprotein alpha-component
VFCKAVVQKMLDHDLPQHLKGSGNAICRDAFYHREMSEVLEQEAKTGAGHAQKYTRNSPYTSLVNVNYLLTAEGSEKETRHVELALEEGMTYTPGDAVGIIPENRAEAVEDVLKALGYKGNERVLDHYKVEITLEEALRTRLGIGKLARGSVGQYAKLAPEVEGLKVLTGAENRARAEEYCWGREFVDLAADFPGVITDPQQLFNVLQRLTPRMYSISSSQKVHSDSVHTTVRVIRYDAHGRNRQGVASGHLGDRAGEGTMIPIFLHSNNNFRLPEDPSAPVIMIGPGTGIAPFRAFLEERQADGATGDNWLFFGEQREKLDFLYKDQLQGMVKDGVLTHLHTAFSRDQHNKVYVQDRIQENAKEVFEWLERGAYFYVCGDATRMAKDVETALLDAIAKGSNGTLEHAAEYLATMKKQKRYQRDVY